MDRFISSWPDSNPAHTLAVGDVFTLAGHYRRRRDWLSRLLARVGIVRNTGELQQFRVVAACDSFKEYVLVDKPRG